MGIDAASPWSIDEAHILLRLILSVCLGGLIGFEREQSNHAAGFRTNILVCLGSCLLMLLSIYGFAAFANETNVRLDPARLAAQVITGIGFLGAGTILYTGKSITGLTTAASVWVVAAIGLAVGAGFYFAAASTTAFVLLTLWAFNKIEKRFVNGRKQLLLKIEAENRSVLVRGISSLMDERDVQMRKISIREYKDHERGAQVALQLHVTLPKAVSPVGLLEDIRGIDGVHTVSSE